MQIERESEREPKPNRLCCFGSEEEEGFLLARERDRDVRPRQANRAAEEVWASQGIRGEGSLSQSHGNPRWREQRSKGRCPCHCNPFLSLSISYSLIGLSESTKLLCDWGFWVWLGCEFQWWVWFCEVGFLCFVLFLWKCELKSEGVVGSYWNGWIWL